LAYKLSELQKESEELHQQGDTVRQLWGPGLGPGEAKDVGRKRRKSGLCVGTPGPTPWRPWTLTAAGSQCEPEGDPQTLRSKGAFGFQHPVRLYLPISKRQEYLRGSGEKVLASFPVQATIHFYNDNESESDEEEQEEETRTPEPGRQGTGGPWDRAGPGCPAHQEEGAPSLTAPLGGPALAPHPNDQGPSRASAL
ncbi:protein ripply3, partial [Heterocephalus glaber]|uniref:Protein ripply3 n=1 Tax=Heterocephalus glaber TaxID=10181 RepID=A0AAX6STN3_HETGA